MSEPEGKLLEILKQIAPKLAQVGVLMNPTNPFTAIDWKDAQLAAHTLQVRLQPAEVRMPEEIRPGLRSDHDPGVDETLRAQDQVDQSLWR